jgi:hypothetical protein
MNIVKGFVITDNGLVLQEAYDSDKCSFPYQEEVQVCQQWIEKFCKLIKPINPEAYSYSLKHKVEKWSGRYVSNGAFILAAVNMGYDVQVAGNRSPNAVFNMRLLLPEHAWKRVRTAGFSRWLFKQKELDTPIGDLARDAIEDETWPRKAKRFLDFWLYLESVNVSEGCLRTLKEAWVACYGKEPAYPDWKIQAQCERFYAGDSDTLMYGDSYPKAPDGKTYIYVLFEPRENFWDPRVRYVGQTANPAQRLRQHITCPGSIKKVIWTGQLLEAGIYPCMGIIELVNVENAAIVEETYIIAFGDNERHPKQSITDVLLNEYLVDSVSQANTR